MPDPRFFYNQGPLCVSDIAAHCNLDFDKSDQDFPLKNVAALDKATADDLSFLDNVKYKDALTKTKAGAVIVHKDMADLAPSSCRVLISGNPYHSYALAAALFYPQSLSHASGSTAVLEGKVDATAIISSDATIGNNCKIGPYVVIEENVQIADNVVIEAHSVIGTGCTIGENSHIGSLCSISHSKIGTSVRIHNGARIGQDGFGFAFTETGFIPVPQLGSVVIHDRVNIGANTTIDRGSGPDTVIGANTIIDNLVQIAHNVEIGQGCIIVAQVGISGSTKVGNYCVIAGQVGISGHLEIGDGVKIGAQSGVSKSIPAKTDVMGSPAQDKREYWRGLATLRRISSKGIKK